jgi:cell shape-determining protein MreC
MPMFQLRFNQVWAGLLVIAAVSAFIFPPEFGDHFRRIVQNIFAPVARPARVIGTSLRDHVVGKEDLDEGATGSKARPDSTLAAENQELRIQVANLSEQLSASKRQSHDRELLGTVRDFCTPVAVVGGDSGVRESLTLQTTSADNVKVGMIAICPTGIVGRIASSGPGGSRLQLITDSGQGGFRVQGRFVRFTADAHYIPINTRPPLVEGHGRGEMVISALTAKEVETAGLQVGDWVVVSDPDWPANIQGYKLGRVTEITRRPDGPLHAQIWVKPTSDLMALREVMIMNKR